MVSPASTPPLADLAGARDGVAAGPDCAHVPPRAVVYSAIALWLTYFALVTLRAVVGDFGDFDDLLWRRALVTLAGIAVTLLTWPVLRRFDGQPLPVRVGAALVIMLPAALALAAVNQRAFASVEERLAAQAAAGEDAARSQKPEAGTARRAGQDEAGNMLIDVGDPPPVPPEPPEPPVANRAPSGAAQAGLPDLWQQLTDVALGRYFLLIAWAALYLALGNAEMVRAAERRAGEYQQAAKAAELRSLRYQVNPHFLFNTLNSLSALVMVGRAEQAERMIQTIAGFYRHSLTADPTADVPLVDEVALQRAYLEIEAVRFPDRLRVEFAVPADLDHACVPGMILQPLVENSIKYAVSASTRPVTIRIAAREAGGLLVLSVTDDGPAGPGTGAQGVADGAGTGIGLANVRSRLEARFGTDARMDSGPLPAGGYATVLTLPILWKSC